MIRPSNEPIGDWERNDPSHALEFPFEYLDRLARLGKWQPIDTAPRDGTAFLAYFPGRGAGYFARQDVQAVSSSGDEPNRRFWFTATGHEATSCRPTHWMPIPTPPAPSSDT